jgi:aspartyl-tRNA(Asn)/glutamyl-tRNA(Gln) amidotransferase subunit A
LAATGSDTGGSVRIPAAFFGCVGFKPTFGRISTAGLLGAAPTFDHSGLLTRTVADARLLYRETAGLDPRDPLTVPTAEGGLTASGPLRIGVARNFFFERLQGDVAKAVEAAVKVLGESGMQVRDLTFPITNDTMADVFDPIVVAEIHQRFARDWRERPGAFSPSFAGFFKAPIPSALALVSAQRALRAYQADVRRIFDDVDVIVTPTVPIAAPPIDGPVDGALILRNTWPFNAARTPALSVPCGVDADGMPVGLQLVAAPYADDIVLQAGEAFQRMTAWHVRRGG